jgi:hypothetical protein
MAECVPSQCRSRYANRPCATAPRPRRRVQEFEKRMVFDNLPRPVPVSRAKLEVRSRWTDDGTADHVPRGAARRRAPGDAP